MNFRNRLDSQMPKIENQLRRRRRKAVAFIAMQCMSFTSYYAYRFLLKTPQRTSRLSGNLYVEELLGGNPNRFQRVARMSRAAFDELCRFLRHHCLLIDTRKGITVERYLLISIDTKI